MSSGAKRKPRPARQRPSTAPEKTADSKSLLPAAAMHTVSEDDPHAHAHEPLNINLGTRPRILLAYSTTLLLDWLISCFALLYSAVLNYANAHADSLPPPFDLPNDSAADCDWATFITAYACGRWDPQRIPPPPAPVAPHPDRLVCAACAPRRRGRRAADCPERRAGLRAHRAAAGPAPPPPRVLLRRFVIRLGIPVPAAGIPALCPPCATSTSTSGVLDAATLRWAGARVRVAPLALPSPEHELTDPMRGAGAVAIPGSHPELPSSHPLPLAHPSSLPLPSGLPLSLPNMPRPPPIHTASGWAGVSAHSSAVQTPGWDVMTPGGTRRSRLSGFWSGTADVDADSNTNSNSNNASSGYTYTYHVGGGGMLPTIDGSPATPDREHTLGLSSSQAPKTVPVPGLPDAPLLVSPAVPEATTTTTTSTMTRMQRRPAPATAPVRHAHTHSHSSGAEMEEDYFGAGALAAAAARAERRRSGLGGGERRMRRRRSSSGSGLRTPPRTREGSAEGSPECSREGEGEDAGSPTQALEGDETQDETGEGQGADEEGQDPEEGKTKETPVSTPFSGNAHDAGLEPHAARHGARVPRPRASKDRLSHSNPIPNPIPTPTPTSRGPSSLLTTTHTPTPLIHTRHFPPPVAYPADDVAFYANAQSVPVPVLQRRGVLARQMSAPPAAHFGRGAGRVWGGVGELEAVGYGSGKGRRALSSDPGRDVLGLGHGLGLGLARDAVGERREREEERVVVIPSTPSRGTSFASASTSAQPISQSTSQLSASTSTSTSTSALALSASTSQLSTVSHQTGPSAPRPTTRAESLFHATHYLAPPFPPDELPRRRALYKFNILGTGADANFDRIAHLAGLVFGTRGVVVEVVGGGGGSGSTQSGAGAEGGDGDGVWIKSEWGTLRGATSGSGSGGYGGAGKGKARATSFAGHAILQRGDEPMIVLDTRADWRFAKNPLVLGPPYIRFYAGAPLRTQDGFNIGCLALVDDTPREEFTPRQRHTLKEFAAIAMRELELWRDKIQLRIRDRIQNSMEQFSRECLEIDSEVQPSHRGSESGGSKSGSESPLPAKGNESPPRKAAQSPRKGDGSDGARDAKANADNALSPPPHPHPHPNHDASGPVHASKNDPHAPAHPAPPDLMGPSSSMDTVYDRAAKLVQRTLDVEGVVVMDVSHCEVVESMSVEGTVSVVLHHGDPAVPATTRTLSPDEHARLFEFFARYPEGKISEGIVPPTLRVFLPVARIQYALVVPIYNIDRRPFALLCAWNASEQSTRFLEGHELSYLRAIGVIILSAVLKRRMILADKAKSLFISNISHELRTPLHGILAAAELLDDSPLNHSQRSFLETVQACGTSLVETVNHVLDFTKLSGNSKAGGVENVIVLTKVDLMQLIEEAVDGCWIGHRARTAIMGDTGIGSVYSPPEELSAAKQLVETVVDIGWRKGGWSLKCEKGGIRRVLMNVFGNSLKFTTNGYVHVELVVSDTGKGISEDFRKNQLFHPFSQENPLQTGTGLGLAIVNSIVKSEGVKGKVDVWSEENLGTELKVTFTAQIAGDDEVTAPEMESFKFEDPTHPVSVSLVGFEDEHKGVQLLHNVLQTYLVSWWGFEVRTSAHPYGEIVILNEDVEPVKRATAERSTSRPFIVLSTLRGNPVVMAIASEHERIGGFCRIIYKPGGPSRLHALLKLCLHAINIGRSGESSPHQEIEEPVMTIAHVPRRNSEEAKTALAPSRPKLSPRSSTAHPLTTLSWKTLSSTAETEEPPIEEGEGDPTVSIGATGTLLRSSMSTGSINSEERRFRVLVVEDNSILRNLLVKWLTTKGYDYRDAVDGRNGVKVYEEEGPFDVVLLDMSMPILDGIGATTQIRQMEAQRKVDDSNEKPTRILALTGMSSLEDKRRAFEAGVDGYLVKPVAFRTLDEMFSKLGVS
ncbi:Histidine kinase [Mycena sanguinolenta]|uniref:histidine kinase n=1 Tax=Mycena sanguinolenta TaxID=230812 RepID=A0A8H7DH26_9AGAR|nr:Histidine kinase [Mycena sanguinolenta]